MPSDAPTSVSDSLHRLRRLLLGTSFATFLLIIIGGVVRVSDSGLGCGPAGSGTHGWPLCTGKVLPLTGGSTLVEFSHRVVAGIVAILIVLIAIYVWRRLRHHSWLMAGSSFGVALVLFQAVLGGLTVEHNLDEVLVAVHLGVAMILLALLLAMYRAASTGPEPEAAAATTALRRTSWTAAVLVLLTIMVGGYVAGTESHGTEQGPVVGAHTACGKDFPKCGDSVLPFGKSSLMDAQLTHRVMMFLATIAVLAMVALAFRRGIFNWPVHAAWILVLLQVLLGAMNVWYGKHAGLIVGHLTLGTLVWAVVVWADLTFSPSSRRDTALPKPASP